MFGFRDEAWSGRSGLFGARWPRRPVKDYEEEEYEQEVEEPGEQAINHVSEDLPRAIDDDVDNLEHQLKRMKADFDNYRRRVEQEREQQVRCSNRELILKLLPVLDDFNYALESVPGEVAQNDVLAGMRLIKDKLESILAGEGVSRVDALGRPFDPWRHDAVFCDDDGGDERCVVKEVIKDGYMMDNEVIRPAQVIVSNQL